MLKGLVSEERLHQKANACWLQSSCSRRFVTAKPRLARADTSGKEGLVWRQSGPRYGGARKQRDGRPQP
jgi:hypothetical protein